MVAVFYVGLSAVFGNAIISLLVGLLITGAGAATYLGSTALLADGTLDSNKLIGCGALTGVYLLTRATGSVSSKKD